MELLTPHHQFGARVCAGLPPDNGYVSKTFFTKKKEIDIYRKLQLNKQSALLDDISLPSNQEEQPQSPEASPEAS